MSAPRAACPPTVKLAAATTFITPSFSVPLTKQPPSSACINQCGREDDGHLVVTANFPLGGVSVRLSIAYIVAAGLPMAPLMLGLLRMTMPSEVLLVVRVWASHCFVLSKSRCLDFSHLALITKS